MCISEINKEVSKWKNTDIQGFWSEIAPYEHLIQVYENEKIFLNTLEGFAGTGFLAGDSVVIIATAAHLEALNARLLKQNFDLKSLMETNQYIPIEANEILSKLLINNWPDEQLCIDFITGLINRAKGNNRKVRAFGELVAILCEQGYPRATVQLENLWNRLHKMELFTLYCAYPKNDFTQCANSSMDTICHAHSKIIDGQPRPSTEIYYKTFH